MRRSFVGACVLGVALAFTPSCSLFQSACAKSVPTMVAAQSYAFDAQQSLDEAREAIAMSGLSTAAKANANGALDRAQAGLKAASASLAAASTACTTPDIAQVFGSFIKAWDCVHGFLALVGGGGVAGVADPEVYVLARGQQE